MMHKFFYIVLLFSCISCTKEVIYNVSGKPILFSQEMEVDARAATSNSVSTMNGKTFGVRGFKYDALWESAEKVTKPDPTWENVAVDCNENGMCNYVKGSMTLQFWEDKKRYAFFGYYPYSTGPTDEVQLSSMNQMGTPVLTYTLSDQAVGKDSDPIRKGDPMAMHDVMYGSVTDANGAQNTSVGLVFRHALFGVQVVAENFHDATPVTIEEFSITLQLKYRKIDIPMNGDAVTRYFFNGAADDGTANTTPVTFDLITKGDPPITINPTLNLPPKDLSKGKHLLLIPQEKISGEARVKIKGKPDQKPIPLNFPNAIYKPGVRYMLDIQFVGEEVNIIIIQGSEWFDNDSIIEFE